jgi:hypothetical protein
LPDMPRYHFLMILTFCNCARNGQVAQLYFGDLYSRYPSLFVVEYFKISPAGRGNSHSIPEEASGPPRISEAPGTEINPPNENKKL